MTAPARGGNHERMAFLFNHNKVFFRNLIGELVFPHDALPGGEQIERTPFFASFRAGWFKFTLCSVSSTRKWQAARCAATRSAPWPSCWPTAPRTMTMTEVHIFLGDMNIDTTDDADSRPSKTRATSSRSSERTSAATNTMTDHFTGPQRKARLLRHGAFDWRSSVFRPDPGAYEATATIREGRDRGQPYPDWAGYYPEWFTHEMSDHRRSG